VSWPSTRPRGARLARWYAAPRRSAGAGLMSGTRPPSESLDRLALWALQRYAPVAAADPPDGSSSTQPVLLPAWRGRRHARGNGRAACRIGHRGAGGDRRQLGPPCHGRYGRGQPRHPGGNSAKAISPANRRPSSAQNHSGDLSVLGFASIGELWQNTRAARLRFVPNFAAVSIRPWDPSANRLIRTPTGPHRGMPCVC